jgi:hypothetical protein
MILGLVHRYQPEMPLKSDYPSDWKEIATAVKKAAGYRCHRCGLACLPPGLSFCHLSLSLRRRLSAQVHHIDGNPGCNERSNLVCLCAGCHLRIHRHPLPSPGQLSLKLKLPKPAKTRRKFGYLQLSLSDLIDRLPRLPITASEQIELDLAL